LDLPAALACDIDVVVEGPPVVVVVGARKDGLSVRESVLSFILPGVPAARVDRRASSSFVIFLIRLEYWLAIIAESQSAVKVSFSRPRPRSQPARV
jgi:hypothetical protein